MVVVFYTACLIAILASIRVISCLRVDKAILYFVISILAIALAFLYLGAYFSAILLLVLLVGGITVLFLYVDYFLKVQTDVLENSHRGISPKIWLGPLILAFILLVILIYGIVSSDYKQLSRSTDLATGMTLSAYLLIAELISFLLLGAIVIVYHFTLHLSREKTS